MQKIDRLIDCLVFYAVPAIFQLCNGGYTKKILTFKITYQEIIYSKSCLKRLNEIVHLKYTFDPLTVG